MISNLNINSTYHCTSFTRIIRVTSLQECLKCLQIKNNHDAFTRHGYCIAIQFYFVCSCSFRPVLSFHRVFIRAGIIQVFHFDVAIAAHAGTGRNQLTNDNVFLQSQQRINFAFNGCVGQHACCFLEGCR